MQKILFILIYVFFLSFGGLKAQSQPAPQHIYSIVIKGGHVIDPKNNIDGLMDIAIHSARSAKD